MNEFTIARRLKLLAEQLPENTNPMHIPDLIGKEEFYRLVYTLDLAALAHAEWHVQFKKGIFKIKVA